MVLLMKFRDMVISLCMFSVCNVAIAKIGSSENASDSGAGSSGRGGVSDEIVQRPYEEQFATHGKLPPSTILVMPWLTGPLLTPSAHVVPVGHINIEPYLFANTTYGVYNSNWSSQSVPNFYTLNPLVPIQIGIISRVDFSMTPQLSWNKTSISNPDHSASNWVANDLPISMGIQLLYDSEEHWWPAIKLNLQANVPIGRYNHLNPDKLGTNIGGAGNWFPGIQLMMSRLIHFTGLHYLAMRWGAGITVPTTVEVDEFNAYGGGFGTEGIVYPGITVNAILGLEYTLSQNWGLALDALYVHSERTRFSGTAGSTAGVLNSIGGPSSDQFSLAPAFEYNWSAQVGIIAGVWFTAAGRNASKFANGVVAVFNIFFSSWFFNA